MRSFIKQFHVKSMLCKNNAILSKESSLFYYSELKKYPYILRRDRVYFNFFLYYLKKKNLKLYWKMNCNLLSKLHEILR